MFFFILFCILGSLLIHPVELADDGDYVCIASNHFGRSFSSRRSLIVTGNEFNRKTLHVCVEHNNKDACLSFLFFCLACNYTLKVFRTHDISSYTR